MKRVIIDYKKLNPNILSLLVQKFPDGYADNDIIVFRNQHNEIIEAVEVRTDEIIYLVKISKRLSESIESFDLGSSNNLPNGPENGQIGVA